VHGIGFVLEIWDWNRYRKMASGYRNGMGIWGKDDYLNQGWVFQMIITTTYELLKRGL